MAVALISEEDFELLGKIVEVRPLEFSNENYPFGYWVGRAGLEFFENSNLNYPLGYWVSLKMLKNLNLIERVKPICSLNDIPVFYGIEAIDKQYYNESLTCISISRHDGSSINGISHIKDYWYDDFCFDLKRCFRFHKTDDPERYWRVIGHQGDKDWLLGYWDDEKEFSSWLRNLDT